MAIKQTPVKTSFIFVINAKFILYFCYFVLYVNKYKTLQ